MISDSGPELSEMFIHAGHLKTNPAEPLRCNIVTAVNEGFDDRVEKSLAKPKIYPLSTGPDESRVPNTPNNNNALLERCTISKLKVAFSRHVTQGTNTDPDISPRSGSNDGKTGSKRKIGDPSLPPTNDSEELLPKAAKSSSAPMHCNNVEGVSAIIQNGQASPYTNCSAFAKDITGVQEDGPLSSAQQEPLHSSLVEKNVIEAADLWSENKFGWDCKVCGKVMFSLGVFWHAFKKHGISKQEYLALHGNISYHKRMIIKHRCMICSEQIIHKPKLLLRHFMTKHCMSTTDYYSRFKSLNSSLQGRDSPNS
jgi:hypothetical protein